MLKIPDVEFKDLVRKPAGFQAIYEVEDIQTVSKMLFTYASKAQAKITVNSLWGFYASSGKPIKLIIVEVVQQGNKVKKRGPKPKLKLNK